MTLTLPGIVPQVLSMGDPTFFGNQNPMPEWSSTNSFLINFLPDLTTGSVTFPNLIDGTTQTLNQRNGDSLRLSALAVTFDAWRILHRLITGSAASRDEIYSHMQQGTGFERALRSTRGDWKIQVYQPNLTPISALKQSHFTDGEETPPLTGHVQLQHVTGRFIDIAMAVPSLGLNLVIGWRHPEIEVAQCVYVDESIVRTAGYYFSISGSALQKLDRARLITTLEDNNLLNTQDLAVLACGTSLHLLISNDSNSFMPLAAPLKELLWDRAIRKISLETCQ